MSKADILRQFVTQRLAAASQEILAVVERTVAAYEAEAAGFREEIDRQRKQLEVLLQPRLEPTTDGVKRNRSHCDEEEVDDDDEEREDGNNQTPSRRQCEQKVSDAQNHIDLMIHVLENPQTEALSKNVLKKCPVLKLKFPQGLQEADFLDLLRSTVPRLAGHDEPFDILMSDKGCSLHHLELKTVTAEEIQRRGTSIVFIRLKVQKEAEDIVEDAGDSSSSVAMLTFDDTRLQTSSRLQEEDDCGVDVLTSSSMDNMLTEDANDEEQQDQDAAAAQSKEDNGEKEGKKLEDSDEEWKPDKSEDDESSDRELKTTKNQNTRCSGVKVVETSNKWDSTFVQHFQSQMDDPGSVGSVSGERSPKRQLQNYHKTSDCHICGESFLSDNGLDEHLATHSGETPHKFDVGDATFALKASLETHRKLEEGKPHVCYTCHKVFEEQEELKAHSKMHASKKTNLCGVCGKSLSDYRSLSRHKMTHSGERPHSCKVCGRSFKLAGTLRQHEKIHMERERLYLCDVCCKMFLTSKQLQIHMRTHNNEKPYHCGDCGRGFCTKGALNVHMRMHTGETPYRCPDCGWAFKRKNNLDDHMTIHSGIKPFVCGICGKACARKTHLTIHMRTHNGERPYKCTLCEKAFTQSHCLKTHMKSHQEADATCR